jgi:eukaryotic-like serine/threonine-protein kinase
VALKILNRTLTSDAGARRRLAGELRAGLAVDHSGVVRTFGGPQPAADRLFLAMELVPAISLAELIALHSALPWREACNYAFQAAVGLGQLHEVGIVHRDVQPGNLLIERDGGLKVADFGTADAAFLRDEAGRAMLPLGAASAYSSPEILSGEGSVDPQSDVFSLGCTIYHALAGSAPFPDRAEEEKRQPPTFPTPPPLRSFVSDLPSEIVRIVKKMMAPGRDKRFTSMSEVARALGPYARRQQSYFDRPVIIAQRSLDARARLRVLARQLAERQQSEQPAAAKDE